MELTSLVFLLIGLAIGYLIAYIISKPNYDKGYQEGNEEANTANQSLTAEINKLNRDLAVALERNKHLSKLEDKIQNLEGDIKSKYDEIQKHTNIISSLNKEIDETKKSYEEKLDIFKKAEEKLKDTFDSMSKTALQNNNENFIKNAKELFEQYKKTFSSDYEVRKGEIENFVKPLHDSLSNFDQFVKDMEKSRNTAYGELKEQLVSMKANQQNLQNETKNLVTALRKPQVRGRWGEIQLKRVVEMAGMLSYCDFYEQVTTDGDVRFRPDMIVRLPNNRNVAVDSKVPLSAYLEAIETENPDEKDGFLKNHAKQLKDHLKKLAAKSYHQEIEPSPEFVVCFLPGEIYFYAALEKDPTLIEYGVENNVIIATPTTLISLLKAVAYGWKQELVTENAKIISELARELYVRISTFTEHLSKVGNSLDAATKNYNNAVGSFESRVLSQFRKFDEMGVAKGAQISEPKQVETITRQLKE